MFLRKHLEESIYLVSAVSMSDVLKRNTASLRCAVENDVFASLPQDSLLVELGMGWEDKGLQCGAEFDSQVTDVVYSGGNDCRFGI